MKKIISGVALLVLVVVWAGFKPAAKNGWISLFDGKSLDGWKVGEHSETFSIENGSIVAHGQTAHLFYVGSAMNHNFKNFEFNAKVMTTPGSNSGIYIHTNYQENGWPAKGYEIQVNNSHTDWRRTGSVYGVQDIRPVYVRDNEWYTEAITVKGKKITIRINDKVVNEYTEPAVADTAKGNSLRRLSSGTFALQGHDPKSIVYYKEIMVKPLAD